MCYLCTEWTDFNETSHEYSSREWGSVEVVFKLRCQSLDQTSYYIYILARRGLLIS